MAGAATSAPIPLITDVITDGSEIVLVIFDQDVTLSGAGASTLTLDGQAGSWTSNASAASLIWVDDLTGLHNTGEPWVMPGPEPLLSPTPGLPENGITT